jgi:hypothetical protein
MWVKTIIQPVILRDLAEKPDGKIEFSRETPPYPMTRLLQVLAPVIQRREEGLPYKRADFFYQLDIGQIRIASVPLQD